MLTDIEEDGSQARKGEAQLVDKDKHGNDKLPWTAHNKTWHFAAHLCGILEPHA